MKAGLPQATQITNLVRSFNAKITNAIKAGMKAEQLPAKLSKEMIQHEIHVGNFSFNQFKAKVERATPQALTKTSKIGQIEVSQYQKKEAERELKRVNIKLAKKREKVLGTPATLHGEDLGYERGKMGDERTQALQPISAPNPKSFAEFDMYMRGLKRKTDKESMSRYKENYILSLLTQHGQIANNIIALIETIPDEEFMNLYYKEESLDITHNYTAADSEKYIDTLTATLERLKYKIPTEIPKDLNARNTQRMTSYIERQSQ